MKKKILMSSVLSIVLCLSLICGATFALFTDTDTVNIAVTAGKVDIEVTVENIMTKSYEQDGWDGDTQFTNGGAVTFDKLSNELIIDKITPGDAVKFDLLINNSSDINIKYRTKVGVKEGVELFAGMNVSIAGVSEDNKFNGVTYTTAWEDLSAVTGTTNVTKVEVIIELPYLTAAEDPENLQSELMGESTTIYYTVEAVQANASEEDLNAIDTGVTHLYTPVDLQLFAVNVNNGNSYAGQTVQLMNDIDLAGINWTPINGFKGTFDGAKTAAVSDDTTTEDTPATFSLAAEEGTTTPPETYKISNLTINGNSSVAFFAEVGIGATIQNVTFDNATVTGNHYVGVILGYETNESGRATITNCHVTNSTVTATPELLNGVWDNGDKVGGIAGYTTTVTITGCSVTNTTVKAYRDFGAIIGCANHASEVTGNTVTDVTLRFELVEGNYADNTPNKNAGQVAGRVGSDATVADNTITNCNLLALTAEDIVAYAENGSMPATIPAGITIELDLTKVKEEDQVLESAIHKNNGAVIVNNGTLTIIGGTISSTGANGGSAILNKGTLNIDGTTLKGAYNANGSWPSYTVNNTGVMTVKNATITSMHGAVASYGEGAVLTLENTNIEMTGISGYTSHGIYTYSGGKVIVNGGNIANYATDQNSTGGSVINGNVEIYGGTFTGRIENYHGTPVIKGGTFSVDPTKYVADGYTATNVNGAYIVLPSDVAVVTPTPDSTTTGNVILDAINAGKTNIYLTAGEYTMPSTSTDVTIIGDKSVVVNVPYKKVSGQGNTITFNGVTVNGCTDASDWYTEQLNGAKKVVYQNCTINGLITTYGDCEFINCVFANSFEDEYSVYCYTGSNILFENCTFNTACSKAIKIYDEGGKPARTVTINNCSFNASASDKAAVEIDSQYGTVYKVYINDCEINEYYTKLWNDKAAGTNVFVYVNGQAQVKNADQLKAAVDAGATDIYLLDGEYNVDGLGGKTLTLNGSKNAVIKLYNDGEDGCDYGFGSAGTGVGSYTFNGITIDTTSNTGNYKGFAYMKGTFNDCNFVGSYSLNNANDFVFNRCTFDFKNGYFWTWGAKSVTFDGCTFNGNSKAILAHGWASTEININNCTFAATEKGYTGAGDNTAAVEVDAAGTNLYTINFTGENTITDSYSGLIRVKDANDGAHTITGLN